MEPKLETKITLYNAEGKRLGETFSRRARQLVKQQRAEWMDEAHTSVQFYADPPEAWETDPHTEAHEPEPDAALLEMARMRVATRRIFAINTLVLVPGFFAIVIFVEVMLRTNQWFTGFWMGTLFTLWTLLFIRNTYRFVKTNRGFFLFALAERRHSRVVANEVERLKRMGYGK